MKIKNTEKLSVLPVPVDLGWHFLWWKVLTNLATLIFKYDEFNLLTLCKNIRKWWTSCKMLSCVHRTKLCVIAIFQSMANFNFSKSPFQSSIARTTFPHLKISGFFPTHEWRIFPGTLWGSILAPAERSPLQDKQNMNCQQKLWRNAY